MRGYLLLVALSAVTMFHTDEYAQIEREVMDFVHAAEARHDLQGLAAQLDLSKISGRLPEADEFSAFARTALKSFERGRDTSRDPWGNPYRLEVEAGEMKLSSSGPDQRPGSADDLVVNVQNALADHF